MTSIPSALLDKDPQPSLLLDAGAVLRAANPAMLAELNGWPPQSLALLLPANHAALVSACLGQQRAISDVESQAGERILLWTFIPAGADQVIARCRDATGERRAEREAAQARRLYRLITENTTDLISRHTPDGCFLDASPASYRLLGYWPEELRGVAVQSLLHPHDSRQYLALASAALERDGYQTMTCRLRHRDGRDLWFEIASRAIRETYTGAVVEIVSVSRDISVRIEAQENRRRLAEVVEANTDLVLFTDPDGRLTYLNASARRALGLTDVQLAPRLRELLDGEALQRLDAEGWLCAEREGVWQCEARLAPYPGGAAFPVSLVLLAHSAAGGERYYSLVARDMTERELRETQQRRHQDELAHTARLVTLGELASGIAHEINQPLAAVLNYAAASQRYLHALERDPQAAGRVAQGLQRISEQATHAAEVIKRLRAFLRKEPRRLQALSVAAVAREAVRLCAWEANQAQVTIEQRMTDNLPPVYADRVLLEQVLLNLLRNAIDANRERQPGQPSRVLLCGEQEGARLLIRVIDQGPGVAPEQLDGIFTPFTTSKPEGLGLGLSMSRSIVEGFGGTLSASPGEGGGLILSCRLAPAASV
ncbi:PAS domain S-box protein [Pseudomonas japonica]|uniref:PAS domain S-box protein n=1 Tax=Pseudomonas TaxID=286 RepID=UPI002927CD05|nr:PAS domain S-box protein [Pseudomonas sp. zfem002]MDU9392418.1 PAS domain S-box protein [Pseudomonas sp. zfem002]